MPLFEPFVSQFVFDEIARGDEDAAQRRLLSVKEFQVLEMMPKVAEADLRCSSEIGF
ncbi:hypothetical protein ACFL6U_06480 [Planctomycetota bacterium]